MKNRIVNKGRKIRSVLVLFVIFCLLSGTSCQHNEIYYRFLGLKDGEWHRDSVLTFVLDSTLFDLNVMYNIDVEITNNASYSYQNIWYTVSSNLDSDSIFTDQQRQYFLANEDGIWLGNGFGSLFQTSIPFKQDIHFAEKRDYIFRISQCMRDNPLVGIEKVGLKVSKSEK